MKWLTHLIYHLNITANVSFMTAVLSRASSRECSRNTEQTHWCSVQCSSGERNQKTKAWWEMNTKQWCRIKCLFLARIFFYFYDLLFSLFEHIEGWIGFNLFHFITHVLLWFIYLLIITMLSVLRFIFFLLLFSLPLLLQAIKSCVFVVDWLW